MKPYHMLLGCMLLVAGCVEHTPQHTQPKHTRPLKPNPSLCAHTPRAARPTIALPNTQAIKAYTLEPARWGIKSNNTDALATTDGFNDAIKWAKQEGYTVFKIPAGQYLVGVEASDIYTRGVELKGQMTYELDDDAVFQMATNSKWNYCVFAITEQTDVTITGGQLRGDRDTHQYGGRVHDEGHGICIQNESERVLVDGTEIHNMTGDGVLIVGQKGDGSSCKDITIQNTRLHHNRRQGVSIVGGVRVNIERNEIDHIQGTSPQFGVDIESLKYTSKDIVIQHNRFHHNAGGDFVNTDGKNVWFEHNDCDQTGLTEKQTDGPIVHWEETDQVIRNNTITVTVGSSNGKWGIIGYVRADGRQYDVPNLIENNTLHGGGIHVAKTNLMTLKGNTIHNGLILGVNTTCLTIEDNNIVRESGSQREDYKLRRVSGTAKNNRINQTYRFDIPMSMDMTFTNSPPHLW